MRKERLHHFRKKLLERKRDLIEEVGKSAAYDTLQDDGSIKDIGDQASNAYNKEFFFELGNGDRKLLKEVLNALKKIESRDFGNCERCSEPISEKRLEAVPFARYCIKCQRQIEAEEKLAGYG